MPCDINIRVDNEATSWVVMTFFFRVVGYDCGIEGGWMGLYPSTPVALPKNRYDRYKPSGSTVVVQYCSTSKEQAIRVLEYNNTSIPSLPRPLCNIRTIIVADH